MNNSRPLVFTAACLGMLLFGIVLISIGSLLPDLIKRFELDEIGAGSLASLLPFGILAGTLVFGPVADRYGYKILLLASAGFILAGLEGIAFSRDLAVLRVFVFMIGMGGGAINGATNALVSDISETGKGANLSLLGVFFGIGALGMPLILGALSGRYEPSSLVAMLGGFVFLPLLFFLFLSFPNPKHTQGFPLRRAVGLLKHPALWGFGAVLFFESSLEGLANNWTTVFLERQLGIAHDAALFALTLFVLGLTLARLLLSSLMRTLSDDLVLLGSLLLILLGILLLYFSSGNYAVVTGGLVVLGAGFAAMFPLVLGWTGDRFAEMSGTAFSLVLVIAIVGNMSLNYLMGIIGKIYGIEFFPLLLLLCWALMGMVLFTIRLNPNKTP